MEIQARPTSRKLQRGAAEEMLEAIYLTSWLVNALATVEQPRLSQKLDSGAACTNIPE